MSPQVCPKCGTPILEGIPHDCSYAPTLHQKVPLSGGAVGTTGSQAVKESVPASRCPDCGEEYRGTSHTNCARAGTLLFDTKDSTDSVTPGSSTKRRLDEPPAEVKPCLDDLSKQLNQYVLVQLLGQGGMGSVWKAWDRKLTRWVAVKFLTVEIESHVKRFDREARLAARLHHPNIAPIYEVGEHNGRHFIVMEYVDGTHLGAADLPPRMAVEIIVKVAHALEAAHREGVIHRDLKPENIMLTAKGWPYVMDFGLAKAVETESSLSVTGDVMGTPAYMSPEQALGKIVELDARSDVYSLAATLYTLLTNEKPFKGQTPVEIMMKVLNDEPIPPRKINPSVPAPVEAIILKGMEKDRNRRYRSALEFAADLERYLSNLEVEAQLPSVATVLIKKIRRNPWPTAVAALVVLLVVAAAIAFKPRPKSPPPQDPIIVSREVSDPASAWREAFRKEREPLVLSTYKTGSVQSPESFKEILKGMPPGEEGDVSGWIRDQVDLAEQKTSDWKQMKRHEWFDQRPEASRILEWCDLLTAALNGCGGKPGEQAQRLPPVRKTASELVAYRGEFRLRVAVLPYPTIRLSRNGSEVALRETPCVIDGLEIADYELTAPGVSTWSLKLEAGRLQNGQTCTITGDVRESGKVLVSIAP